MLIVCVIVLYIIVYRDIDIDIVSDSDSDSDGDSDIDSDSGSMTVTVTLTFSNDVYNKHPAIAKWTIGAGKLKNIQVQYVAEVLKHIYKFEQNTRNSDYE